MGQKVLRLILEDIKKAKFFAVIADKTRDISNKEQLSICIRWVSENYTVYEDFIGMLAVTKFDADSLVAAITDILCRCCLKFEDCRGQAYDGAAAMMGKLNEVATQLKIANPAALPVHCLAHCLNLGLQSTASECSLIRDTLGLVSEIYSFICKSPKHDACFDVIKQSITPKAPGLRLLCPTRWTVRAAALNSISENYETLLATFEDISDTCSDEFGVRASGLLTQMTKFDTFFAIRFGYMVFAKTENLATALQTKSVTIGEALTLAKVIAKNAWRY
jgi:hypothetical protein